MPRLRKDRPEARRVSASGNSNACRGPVLERRAHGFTHGALHGIFTLRLQLSSVWVSICIGILNHLFFWPEPYRRTGGMSIVFLVDENPNVASAGLGGAALGGGIGRIITRLRTSGFWELGSLPKSSSAKLTRKRFSCVNSSASFYAAPREWFRWSPRPEGADRGWEVSQSRALVGYVLIRRLGYKLKDVAKCLGRALQR